MSIFSKIKKVVRRVSGVSADTESQVPSDDDQTLAEEASEAKDEKRSKQGKIKSKLSKVKSKLYKGGRKVDAPEPELGPPEPSVDIEKGLLSIYKPPDLTLDELKQGVGMVREILENGQQRTVLGWLAQYPILSASFAYSEKPDTLERAMMEGLRSDPNFKLYESMGAGAMGEGPVGELKFRPFLVNAALFQGQLDFFILGLHSNGKIALGDPIPDDLEILLQKQAYKVLLNLEVQLLVPGFDASVLGTRSKEDVLQEIKTQRERLIKTMHPKTLDGLIEELDNELPSAASAALSGSGDLVDMQSAQANLKMIHERHFSLTTEKSFRESKKALKDVITSSLDEHVATSLLEAIENDNEFLRSYEFLGGMDSFLKEFEGVLREKKREGKMPKIDDLCAETASRITAMKIKEQLPDLLQSFLKSQSKNQPIIYDLHADIIDRRLLDTVAGKPSEIDLLLRKAASHMPKNADISSFTECLGALLIEKGQGHARLKLEDVLQEMVDIMAKEAPQSTKTDTKKPRSHSAEVARSDKLSPGAVSKISGAQLKISLAKAINSMSLEEELTSSLLSEIHNLDIKGDTALKQEEVTSFVQSFKEAVEHQVNEATERETVGGMLMQVCKTTGLSIEPVSEIALM